MAVYDTPVSESEDDSVFYKIGYGVSTWAKLCLLIGIVVNAGLATGLSEASKKTEVEELWIKQDGRIKTNLEYQDDHTAPGSSSTNELVTIIGHGGTDVLTENVLEDHLASLQRVTDVVVTVGGNAYTLNDLCSNPSPYEYQCTRLTVLDCFFEGQFDYPLNAANLKAANPTYFYGIFCQVVGQDPAGDCAATYAGTPEATQLAYVTGAINAQGGNAYNFRPSFRDADTDIHQTVSDGCYFWDNGVILPQIQLELAIGGPTPEVYSSGTPLTRADALEAVYVLLEPEAVADRLLTFRGITVTTGQADDILKAWKFAFVDAALDATAEANARTQTNAFSSETFSQLLDEYSNGSAPLLAAGYTLLVVYAAVSMVPWGEPNLRFMAKPLVGVGGVLLVALAIAAALGLCSLLGIEFNPTSTQVLPFLLLGLGVDDMFVMANTFPAHDMVQDPVVLTARTLAVVGPSITLTSFTNAAVFLVGAALTPLPVVSDFANMAAVAIFLAYLSTLFVFPAVLTMDHRRLQARSNALVPCCAGSDVDSSDAPKTKNTRSLSGVSAASSSSHLKSQVVPRLAVVLTSPLGAAVVMLFFCVFVGVAAYGAAELEEGLSLREITPEGTQGYEFNEVRFTYFGFYSMQVVSAEGDYSSTAVQLELMSVFERVMATSHVLTGSAFWLLGLLQWANPDMDSNTKCDSSNFATQGNCGPRFDCNYTFVPQGDVELTAGCSSGFCAVMPPADFERCLQQWFDVDAQAAVFQSNIQVDDDGDIIFPIAYAEMPLYAFGLFDTDEYVTLIEEVYAVTDSSADVIRTFPLGTPFTYWEQYLTIKADMWNTIGWSLLICFLCSSSLLLLVPDSNASHGHAVLVAAWGGVVLTAVVALHVFQVYGFLGVSGIKLSALPVISLIMTVGVGVEFTAHITLAFITAEGTRSERVQHALDHMFVPTVNGTVSTLLGVVMLAFSEFEFIFKYFFLLYLYVILFGILNGLLLLPTLLAFLGPPSIADGNVEGGGGGGKKTALSSDNVTLEDGGAI